MCDDSDWFAALLEAWTEQHDDLEFAGSADDRVAALGGLAAARPDMILLDTMTYGLEPITVDEVRAAVPAARILLCSGYPAEFAAGIVGQPDGYVAGAARERLSKPSAASRLDE